MIKYRIQPGHGAPVLPRSAAYELRYPLRRVVRCSPSEAASRRITLPGHWTGIQPAIQGCCAAQPTSHNNAGDNHIRSACEDFYACTIQRQSQDFLLGGARLLTGPCPGYPKIKNSSELKTHPLFFSGAQIHRQKYK